MKPLLPVMKEKVSFGTQLFNAFILTFFLLQSHLLLLFILLLPLAVSILFMRSLFLFIFFQSAPPSLSVHLQSFLLLVFFLQDFIIYSLWNA